MKKNVESISLRLTLVGDNYKNMKTIKVKELIKALRKLDPNKNIYMSSDTEGNHYSTINEMNVFQLTEDGKSAVLWPFQEYLEYEQIDSVSKTRSDYFEKRKKELMLSGKTDREAIDLALKEAYDTGKPFIK